ncbi:alkaline phosphatase D family protein [Streptomyces sp. DSM 44917]|uniref:Alkaline phosphatase D family protein n=1 Tax=Streptomyces boetiae TaxID=3075541 RepID=A0ABU2LCF3_9ACTN|nr:alkaline phosphatase D family protein [Streptomyces sp. DSM 44917]MDT0309192.1 alkaline phosphatase D family protein [Streptomyces sp. DSM 44917]
MTHTAPTRRTVVTAAAAAAAVLPMAAATTARAADGPAFHHGVASGDPLPDGVLLWTRVTPTPAAVPGSGEGPDTEVTWEVARDAEFRTVVASGSVTASAASDHTVKADVRGLEADTAYHYRFAAGGAQSPAGRTRTAPATGAAPAGLRLGVVSCSNYEAGHFAAYRHLAARRDLHAVLHLGDYLYEYATGSYPADPVRPHRPAHEIVTLADYRVRHGHYRTDPDLRALHAAHPVIAIWDDHETANDAWREGAQNHTPGEEGDWAARRSAAVRAYFEWMPVRPAVEGTTYRRLRFGTLADLHLLDLRSFRDQQAGIGNGAVDDPARTLTGAAQLDWLTSGLSASDTRWHLIGNSVMISPVAFGSVPAYLLGPIGECLGLPAGGLAVFTDQWDGYTADRDRLLGHLHERRVTNTVFLTGDIHMHWANDVPLRAATYPLSPSVATEFVVTSVTSDNVDDLLGVPPHTLSGVAETAIKAANRHVRWLDMDSHGYAVLDVTPERARMDYYVLSDRADPAATSTLARSYQTLDGTQRVTRA